ncbi:cysteine desulfurase [candidate division KSB1 bacterium]|nr:cysteine desulfurase [candidate division KSB1 bacterium]
MNIKDVRKYFPIFEMPENRDLIYFDNAATSQRPLQVIKTWDKFNREYNANTHRGAYRIAEKATQEYEKARDKVAGFIGAGLSNEIVFVRGATEAINFVAYGWALKHVQAGDEILLSELEHHSNLVPWQMVAQKTGAKLKFIEFDESGQLKMEQYFQLLSAKTRLVAITQMSNVLGSITDVKSIINSALQVNARVLVDGAQTAPHMPVNVSNMDADFYVFSGHKMLGPMGTGVLYAKRERFEEMDPVFFGGSMISDVDYNSSTWNDIPWKFEAGTQNIPGVIGLGAAVDFLQQIGPDSVRAHDQALTDYALEQMQLIGQLKIFGPLTNRGPVISFSLADIHPHDLATFLDSHNIAIRAGHHCAKLIMKRLHVPATARTSFYLYNNKQEIDQFVITLDKAKDYFSKWI